MRNSIPSPGQPLQLNLPPTCIRTASIRIFAAIIGFVIAFASLELSYRAYKLISFGFLDYPDKVALGMYKFDPTYGMLPTPNFSSETIPEQIRKHPRVQGYTANVSFNRWGYRGKDFDFAKAPGTFRIVILGGSTTQNAEVSDEHTWAARLEAKLQSNREFLQKVGAQAIEVINGGLGGSRTREGLLRFEQDVVRMQPDLILVAYTWNDIHYGVAGMNPDEVMPYSRPWWYHSKMMQNVMVRWGLLQHRSASTWQDRLARMTPSQYWAIAYKRNLVKMSSLSRQIGAQMVLINLPGLCRAAALDTPEYSLAIESTRENAASFQYWVKTKQFATATLQEVAKIEGRDVVDVSSDFEKFSNAERVKLFADKMHTTEVGSEEIANSIYAHLTRRL